MHEAPSRNRGHYSRNGNIGRKQTVCHRGNAELPGFLAGPNQAACVRDVVRQKHPGIEEAWILRLMAEPLEELRQVGGRYILWGLVPVVQNRALRVIALEDRETVHNDVLRATRS